MQPDTALLVKTVSGVMRDYVALMTAPLLARIDALEKREQPAQSTVTLEAGDIAEKIGAVLDEKLVQLKIGLAEPLTESQMREVLLKIMPSMPEVKHGRDGLDGRDATDEQVTKAVAAYMAANPPSVPKDGRDGVDGDHGRDGLPGRDGEDGKSVTVEDIQPLIDAGIANAALSYERHANGLLQSAIERIAKPENVTKEQVALLCREQLAEAIKALPKPKDGEDGTSITLEDVLPIVMDATRKAVDEIPRPKDGKDGLDGRDVTHEQVAAAVSKHFADHPIKDGRDGRDGVNGEDGHDGVDGKSITIDDVLPKLMEHIQKALDAIPVPKDGESVTVDDIRPLLASMNAEYALDFEKRMQSAFQAAVDKIPKPKDGRDAFDIDTFEISMGDDDRTMTVSLGRDEQRIERSIKLKHILYRDIWKPEVAYSVGDTVTYDGSQWTCRKDCVNSKPGDHNSDWRLSVRKGRNGKDK